MNRTALFHGTGQPFELVNPPTPTLNAGEILVRVRCCALCKSDLHTHAGRRIEPTPTVLGHEICGEIIAFRAGLPPIDSRGQRVESGQRITWAVAVGCGECFFCLNRLPQKCSRLYKYGHERVNPARPFAGGLSSLVVLAPNTTWFRVPDSLPDAIASFANCSTATCVAVLRRAGDVRDRCVVVLGAGMLGITACAMLATAGAKQVIAVDSQAANLVRATQFGATHTANLSDELTELVQHLTHGRGADVVLELAGAAATVQRGLGLLRIGGTLVLAGTVAPVGDIAFNPEHVVRRMLTIHGVHNYHPDDLGAALDFLAGAGQAFPFASLVAGQYPLSNVEEAFSAANQYSGLRIVVTPDGESS